MSTPISIFLNSGREMADTVTELQNLLGITFERTAEDNNVRFSYRGLGFVLVLFDDHGLVDDRGISFSQYAIEMDIEPASGSTDNLHWRELQYTIAKYVYCEVTRKLKHPAMLVDNLQTLIAAD
jgi:hypothetical protein